MNNTSRFADVPVARGGTPARDWLPWLHGLPQLAVDDCPGLVVVAPHPDDETLGFGATAAAAVARGVTVRTVVVSDGGAAWAGLSSGERARLERQRRHESRCASEVLGLAAPTFFGLPDGRLADCESRLADMLTEVLADAAAGTWCAATWRGDGHPDHEAVGRAAATATCRTEAALLEYPVWMWHWARPGDATLPRQRVSRMPLDDAAVQRKWKAIEMFRSQLEPDIPGLDPILPTHVLSRLERVGEVVFG